jgi:3-dehydroquinate synthase
VELKRDVVAEDEFDTGARMKLNLGHTIGHGVEAGSNFELSHGKSVAIGTAIVTRATFARGICSWEVRDQILGIFVQFGLPVSCGFTPEELTEFALSDKKRSGATINLILPKKIGSCVIETTAIAHLQSFIEAGL